MRSYVATFVLAALALAPACSPSTPQPKPPEATPDAATAPIGDAASPSNGDASPPTAGGDCAAACANLAALGCPEGAPKSGQSCVEVCNHAQSSHLTDLKPACLAAAKTAADARACKTVKCADTKP